jgi:hypothetical protein
LWDILRCKTGSDQLRSPFLHFLLPHVGKHLLLWAGLATGSSSTIVATFEDVDRNTVVPGDVVDIGMGWSRIAAGICGIVGEQCEEQYVVQLRGRLSSPWLGSPLNVSTKIEVGD